MIYICCAQTTKRMPFSPKYKPQVLQTLFLTALWLISYNSLSAQNYPSTVDTIVKARGSLIEYRIFYGNKNYREIVRLKQGAKHGKQETYYTDGNKATSEEFQNGHLDGTSLSWDNQGALNEKKNYKYDTIKKQSFLNGEYVQYVNNKIRKRINYKLGKKNGKYSEYYANAVLKTKCSYEEDQLIGIKEDYNNTGQLLIKSNYVNSQSNGSKESCLDGGYSAYSSEGVLIISGNYSNNKKTGVWLEYTNKGFLSSQVEYKNGKRYGVATYYYDNGKLKSKNTFYEEILINNKTMRGVYDNEKTDYYSTGKIQWIENYKMGLKDGLFERYSENGILTEHKEFKNGLQVGAEFYYDSKGIKTSETIFEIIQKDTASFSQKTDTSRGWKEGVLISETQFLNGKENGMRTSFYPSGKICSEYSLKDGLLQGKSIEYFENGQIKTVRNYYTPTNSYSQSSKNVDWSYTYMPNGTLIGKTFYDSTENVLYKKDYYNGIISALEIGKCLNVNFSPVGKIVSIQVKDLYRRTINGQSFYQNGKTRRLDIQDSITNQFSALNFLDNGEYLGCTLEMNYAPDSLLSSTKTAELMIKAFGDHFIDNNFFSDSILNGHYELKYANGKKMGSLEFLNDLPNGHFVFYDPWSSDTLSYKYFENGYQTGYYVEKFAGKKITHRGKLPSYNNLGWEEQYSLEGIPTSRRVFNKDQSKIIESIDYFSDGKIKSINNYSNGTSSYYDNDGSLLFQTVLLNDSLKQYREYYPGTAVIKTSRFILNDKQDSLYSTYFSSGKPQTYQYYKNNKREGLFQTFNEKEEVTYYGTFINDLQEGAFIDLRSGKNDTLWYVGGKLQIKSTNIECACVDTVCSTSKLRFAQSVSSLIEYPQLMNYISPALKLKDSLNFNSLFFTSLQTDNNNNAGFASFELQMFKDFSIMIPADEQLILNFNPCRTNGYLSKMMMMVNYEPDNKNTYVTLYPKRVAISFAKGPMKSSNTNFPLTTVLVNVESVEYRKNKELILKPNKTPDYCFSPARIKDFLDIKIISGEISLFNNTIPLIDRNFQDLSGLKYSELNNFFGIVADNVNLTFPLKTSKGLRTQYAKGSKTLAGGKFVCGSFIIACKKISEDYFEIDSIYEKEGFRLQELKTMWIKNGFTRIKSYYNDKTNELTIYYFAE